MRSLLLFLAAVSVALGQPTITLGPFIHYKSDSQAVIYWETNVSSTHITEWGVASGNYTYGGASTRTMRTNSNNTMHAWYLTGMPANTTIYYRVGSSTNGSNCNEGVDCTFSAERTLTTDAATYPLDPTPPDESWITSVHGGNINTVPAAANGTEWDTTPGGAGRMVTINSSCVQPSTGKTLAQVLSDLASLNGSGVMHIKIPSAASCVGQFTFPARPSHNDWVVVTSDSASIPPEGVKISNQFSSYLPSFKTNVHWARRLTGLTGATTTCLQGEGFFNLSITTGAFPLYLCGANGTAATGLENVAKTVNAFNPGTGVWTTSAAHGWATGDRVRMTATGTTADNLSFVVTVLSTTTFSLDGYTPGGSFDGSGNATKVRAITAYNAGNGQFTATAHGLVSGNTVQINQTGLSGLTGTLEVAVVDTNTFTVRNATITGSFTGTGTVHKIGDYRNVNDMGILTSAAGAPVGSCTDGNYYYNTSASNNHQTSGYLCTGGTWTQYQWNSLGGGVDYATIKVSPSAQKYRFVGLNITRVPGVSTNVISLYGGSPKVNYTGLLADIDLTGNARNSVESSDSRVTHFTMPFSVSQPRAYSES